MGTNLNNLPFCHNFVEIVASLNVARSSSLALELPKISYKIDFNTAIETALQGPPNRRVVATTLRQSDVWALFEAIEIGKIWPNEVGKRGDAKDFCMTDCGLMLKGTVNDSLARGS